MPSVTLVDRAPLAIFEVNVFFCKRPPPGWACSRDFDHDGSCAAYQIYPLDEKASLILRSIAMGLADACFVKLEFPSWASYFTKEVTF